MNVRSSMKLSDKADTQGFRGLRVWQLGIQLVKTIYGITNSFPDREKYGLVSQMNRAAVSIPSNIAEGYLRANRKEYLHFLAIAQSSLAELETQLEISRELRFVSEEEHRKISRDTQSLARQLWTLRKKLKEFKKG